MATTSYRIDSPQIKKYLYNSPDSAGQFTAQYNKLIANASAHNVQIELAPTAPNAEIMAPYSDLTASEAFYNPSTNTIYLNRKIVGYNNLDYIKSLIAHELSHFGDCQAGIEPEVIEGENEDQFANRRLDRELQAQKLTIGLSIEQNNTTAIKVYQLRNENTQKKLGLLDSSLKPQVNLPDYVENEKKLGKTLGEIANDLATNQLAESTLDTNGYLDDFKEIFENYRRPSSILGIPFIPATEAILSPANPEQLGKLEQDDDSLSTIGKLLNDGQKQLISENPAEIAQPNILDYIRKALNGGAAESPSGIKMPDDVVNNLDINKPTISTGTLVPPLSIDQIIKGYGDDNDQRIKLPMDRQEESPSLNPGDSRMMPSQYAPYAPHLTLFPEEPNGVPSLHLSMPDDGQPIQYPSYPSQSGLFKNYPQPFESSVESPDQADVPDRSPIPVNPGVTTLTKNFMHPFSDDEPDDFNTTAMKQAGFDKFGFVTMHPESEEPETPPFVAPQTKWKIPDESIETHEAGSGILGSSHIPPPISEPIGSGFGFEPSHAGGGGLLSFTPGEPSSMGGEIGGMEHGGGIAEEGEGGED